MGSPLEQAMRAARWLDLEAFERAPLVRQPFLHVIVPRFLKPEVFAGVLADFPKIEKGGSFPRSELKVGPACAEFLDLLEGNEVRQAFSRKFGMDLAGRPTMVTLRGMIRPKDGAIHADSRTKLISALIYLNETWNAVGGRLRLLRSRHDLNDFFAEIDPVEGNLVAFGVSADSWHGHSAASGPRRAVQLNWLTDEGVLRRELGRHRVSARLKRFLPFGRPY